ncbi:hypothetical protein EYF80_029406 [Liparis tanakae]|uniref:Uncharacterized protein n=1 Tax=Liparis tanakae TaxID=230148 RepID=A0A4Z2H3I3_9TELE|nr:hypothetical protein EYF80_029406 [Liparis tanakae]
MSKATEISPAPAQARMHHKQSGDSLSLLSRLWFCLCSSSTLRNDSWRGLMASEVLEMLAELPSSLAVDLLQTQGEAVTTRLPDDRAMAARGAVCGGGPLLHSEAMDLCMLSYSSLWRRSTGALASTSRTISSSTRLTRWLSCRCSCSCVWHSA